MRFQIWEKDMTNYRIAELLSVQVIDLLRRSFIDKLDTLVFQGLCIFKDIRKIEVQGFRILNRQDTFDVLPNLKIHMQQILNVDNVKWKCCNNRSMEWQYFLLAFDECNIMVKTIPNQVTQQFNLFQRSLWGFIFVKCQKLCLLIFCPHKSFVTDHLRY